MSDQRNWYTMIPKRDRVVVDAVANWLRPFSWQWFVTLTFPWNVRGETADIKLKKWLNVVERTLKTQVCFVAGKEHKPQAHGMEVPWHFLVLVTSNTASPEGLLGQTWLDLVSPGRTNFGKGAAVNDRVLVDSVLVESYAHGRMGPEYALKSLNSCDGDWQFRWLELFHPRMR